MTHRQIPCGAATGHGEHCHAAGLCCACEEIARLRALVQEAFHEGLKAAYCTALTDEEAVAEFGRSAAKKALDP